MIDETLLEDLRRALIQRLQDPTTADGEIREALRAVSRAAQARGVRAEQVVIALKHAWDEYPGVHDAGGREERLRALERLVTLCIEAYYTDT